MRKVRMTVRRLARHKLPLARRIARLQRSPGGAKQCRPDCLGRLGCEQSRAGSPGPLA